MKKFKWVTVLVLICSLLLMLCGCKDNNDSAGGNLDNFKNLKYGAHQRHSLDIFLPNKLKNLHKAVPVFVMIHGGSWTGGSKADFYYLRDLICGNGYAMATINYRLIPNGATYIEMLQDIDNALAFIKDHGSNYKLRTDRIALWGHSAGAHLSMLYATKIKQPPIDIAFVVGMAGPSDFTDEQFYSADGFSISIQERLDLLSGLVGEQVAMYNITTLESIKDASPIYHIGASTPPMLLCYGKLDDLVPYSNGQRLHNRLQDYHVTSMFFTYEHSGHALENDEEMDSQALAGLHQATSALLPK